MPRGAIPSVHEECRPRDLLAQVDGAVVSNSVVSLKKLGWVSSFNQRLLLSLHLAEAQMSQRVFIASHDDGPGGKHGVVRVDVGRILRSLFYGVHLLFTGLLVHGANHDRLPESYVSCGAHLGLDIGQYVESHGLRRVVPTLMLRKNSILYSVDVVVNEETS